MASGHGSTYGDSGSDPLYLSIHDTLNQSGYTLNQSGYTLNQSGYTLNQSGYTLKEGLFQPNDPTLQQIVSILKNYNTQDIAKCNETISKIRPMLQSSSTQITDTNITANITKILGDSSLTPLQQMDKIIALNIPTTETTLYPLISENLGTRYTALITMLQNLKQLEDTPTINPNSFSNDGVLTNSLNKAIGSPVVHGGATSYVQLYSYMQQAYPSLNLTPIPTNSA
jgi:hypothetical protein